MSFTDWWSSDVHLGRVAGEEKKGKTDHILRGEGVARRKGEQEDAWGISWRGICIRKR